MSTTPTVYPAPVRSMAATLFACDEAGAVFDTARVEIQERYFERAYALFVSDALEEIREQARQEALAAPPF